MTWLAGLPAWRRNQYATTVTVFAVYTGFAFVIPFLPLYARELGVSDAEAAVLWGGVMIAVAPLGAGLMAPVWGRLADRHGRKPMVAAALLIYVVLLGLSAIVTNVQQLLALRVGVGLFGGIGPLGLAMASALAPREETGRVVGSVQAAQNLSAAVGPLLGGLLADMVGRRATFLVAASACIVAWLVLVSFYQEPERMESGADQPPPPSLRSLLAGPGLPALLLLLFFVNFASRSLTPVLPMQLPLLGVSESRASAATGLLISCYSVAAAVSAAALGRAAGGRPAHRLLAGSLALGGLFVLLMASAPSLPVMLGAAVAFGLATGGALTLCYTLGGLLTPEASRASVYGVFGSSALFGGALAPVLAGVLAHWDLHGIYYVDAGVLVVLSLVALSLGRRVRPLSA